MIAIRGAICASNTKDSIYEASAMLVKTVLLSNNIDINTVVAIVFSTTSDLQCANPATAVREVLGIFDTALFSTQEMSVDNSLAHCIRVMVLCDVVIDKHTINHCYLGDASVLRQDLK